MSVYGWWLKARYEERRRLALADSFLRSWRQPKVLSSARVYSGQRMIGDFYWTEKSGLRSQ